MKKTFLSFIIVGLLLISLVAAQQQESVKAGTTPDSVFYGLDKASEAIRLALTFSHVKKAELHLKYSEERLAEAQEMIEKNKVKYLEKLMAQREKHINKTNDEIAKAQTTGKDVTAVAEKVEQATSKHIAVLTALLDKVPESAKEFIQHAIEMSSKGMQRALEAVTKEKEKPEEKPEKEITPGKPEEIPKKGQEPETKASGKGKLNMQITDKKPETLNITALEVTLSEIKVHAAAYGTVSDEDCTSETTTEEICTNETVSEVVPVCVNETVTNEVCTNETFVEEVCVNETINGTITEVCTNETTTEEICTNETTTEEVCTDEIINTTVTNCENVTTTVEICADTSETSAGWFTIVEGPVTFDLIQIKDVKEFLGSKELTAGKYTQIRLAIDNAKLFISDEEKPLKIPGGKIKLVKNFNIGEGQTTTLTLDFDAEKSVHQAGEKYIMKPTIKVIQES